MANPVTPPKFGRAYTLAVQATNGTTIQIELPFTVEFDITRNIFSSTNVAQIRVLNLKPSTRNLIRKNVMDLDDIRTVVLKAGYGVNQPVVFSGNITQAWSVRESTNLITSIESFDGGFAFATATTNRNFPADTEMSSVLESMVGDLPNVSLGAIGTSFNYSIGSRGNTYSGSTAELLSQLSNGQFFIDQGKAYILAQNECIAGQISIINADAGLLGTPLREQSFITFDMIFEPRVVCGQLITLQSSTDANFNGQYKVAAVKHRGMISPAICGEAITSLTLDASAQSLLVVN